VSEENVELVRRSIASANAGDWESVFRDGAPNWELDFSRAQGLFGGVYRGEEAQRVMIDSIDDWQSVRFEPNEFIEVGEHVVVPWTMHFGGRDGIEVQARNTWTFTIRDGMVVRTCLYQDKREALKAVGLSE
jgi:ketosteroid isomerase-like protein